MFLLGDYEQFFNAEQRQRYGAYQANLETSPPEQIKALVVPHHVVAAGLTAQAIALLTQLEVKPTAVIVIGPNHSNSEAAAATTRLGWQTVSGNAEAEQTMITALLQQGLIKENDALFQKEHSIAAIIPWIVEYLPGTPVVPIIFHYQYPLKDLQSIMAVLDPWLQQGAVLVASIDFAHGLARAPAERNDKVTRAAIQNGDSKKIAHLDSKYLDAPTLLAALLDYFADQQQLPPYILANTNSGDLLQNSQGEVTSYFTIAF